MKRFAFALTLLLWGVSATAQSLAGTADDLKLQVHGFATQGFLYTTRNNWATTNSSDGSAAWTEAVVNLTAQPESKLRIGVQARYFLLGDYGNKITLDWAQADYKVNEHFGFRAGKVKTPTGLFNETQDIDPAFLWILLPQAVYPLPSRNSNLAHFGGIGYGTIPMGERIGRLEYHAFGGELVIPPDDGYFTPLRNDGLTVANGISGPIVGGSVRWIAPLRGFLLGAAEASSHESGSVLAGPVPGTFNITRHRRTYYFLSYDHNRLLFAGEFGRNIVEPKVVFPGPPPPPHPLDFVSFYAMASYRATDKFSAGLYYSSFIDRQARTASDRYQKDWTLSARYDFNASLYAKVEQHFMDGTAINYSAADNTNLQPNTRMTLLKLGVTF